MGTQNPPATLAQFKTIFSRDFTYGPGIDKVRDVDIQNAMNSAYSVFNPRLFDCSPIGFAPNIVSESIVAFCNATAHFLVTSIQGAGGLNKVGRGVKSQGEGLTSNKGVGGVSLGMSWPAAIADSPALFQMTRTTYGLAYLQVLVLKLVGNVGVVSGETTEGIPPNPGFV